MLLQGTRKPLPTQKSRRKANPRSSPPRSPNSSTNSSKSAKRESSVPPDAGDPPEPPAPDTHMNRTRPPMPHPATLPNPNLPATQPTPPPHPHPRTHPPLSTLKPRLNLHPHPHPVARHLRTPHLSTVNPLPPLLHRAKHPRPQRATLNPPLSTTSQLPIHLKKKPAKRLPQQQQEVMVKRQTKNKKEYKISTKR